MREPYPVRGRWCARYALSDGTLCSTHNARFTNPRANRCAFVDQLATRPVRIQRRRANGWRMPEGAIYVGRPTEWGNPYAVGDDWGLPGEGPMSRDDVVLCFETYVAGKLGINPRWLAPLRGHDLVCWCPLDQRCHADVLLERANRP